MNNAVEITREAFKALVTNDVKCINILNKELYSAYYYHTKGCNLMQVDNFASCTTQYYIQDINA